MISSWAPPEGVELRLVLVRHGEPEPASQGRCYGRLDLGLSERGRRQVERWLESAAGLELDAVYTSPRRRARESADLLATAFGQPVEVDERLSEMDFGDLEGMRYEEVEARHPELYRRWMERPTEIRFPGGESFAIMKARVLASVADLQERHRKASVEGARAPVVAIVAHGGVHRILLADALGLSEAMLFRIDQSFAGVSVIDLFPAMPVVRLLNAVARTGEEEASGC